MNTPNDASDTTINRLWEDGPILPASIPELFFHTRKRHRPDIYECRTCGHQFPHDTECPSCGSSDMRLFMRAPSRAEVRAYCASSETTLNDIDPDWRERFHGDADLALKFYGRVP